jgi:hypothetical protein
MVNISPAGYNGRKKLRLVLGHTLAVIASRGSIHSTDDGEETKSRIAIEVGKRSKMPPRPLPLSQAKLPLELRLYNSHDTATATGVYGESHI